MNQSIVVHNRDRPGFSMTLIVCMDKSNLKPHLYDKIGVRNVY